jgi:hypothetical protein
MELLKYSGLSAPNSAWVQMTDKEAEIVSKDFVTSRSQIRNHNWKLRSGNAEPSFLDRYPSAWKPCHEGILYPATYLTTRFP